MDWAWPGQNAFEMGPRACVGLVLNNGFVDHRRAPRAIWLRFASIDGRDFDSILIRNSIVVLLSQKRPKLCKNRRLSLDGLTGSSGLTGSTGSTGSTGLDATSKKPTQGDIATQ